jgi:DNA-directed RNA polymerase specialized sigma24 family protein
VESRSDLWLEHRDRVQRHVLHRVRPGSHRDDVLSEVDVAGLLATRTWKPELGASFTTYAIGQCTRAAVRYIERARCPFSFRREPAPRLEPVEVETVPSVVAEEAPDLEDVVAELLASAGLTGRQHRALGLRFGIGGPRLTLTGTGEEMRVARATAAEHARVGLAKVRAVARGAASAA